MAYICENCGKKSVTGRQHQHKRGVAGGRWKKRVTHTRKVFKPNLQRATIIINGAKKKMLLCTKCLRTLKKANKAPDA